MRERQVICRLVSIFFDNLQSMKLYKTLDYWSRDTLNFYFVEKGLGIVSLSHFVYDFSRKMFLVLYSFINWPNFIVWLPLFLEILCNIHIRIVCFPGCDVMNFEKYSDQAVSLHDQKVKTKNLNILRTKRDFKVK